MSERPSIEELIERSSLGSAEAKAARESVDPGIGRAIALAARYLGERNRARDLAVALEQQLARVEALEDRLWSQPDCENGCIHRVADEMRTARGADQ